MYASGRLRKIQKSLFRGTLQLEDANFGAGYLLWKQENHIFAAVDRFNVIYFWNSITGKLIYKSFLEEED